MTTHWSVGDVAGSHATTLSPVAFSRLRRQVTLSVAPGRSKASAPEGFFASGSALPAAFAQGSSTERRALRTGMPVAPKPRSVRSLMISSSSGVAPMTTSAAAPASRAIMAL